MVRIKGENSDYKYDRETHTIQAVQPQPDQLYLQLYVCPYDHPSPVEPHQTDCCHGTDQLCPEASAGQPAAGHALIRLDQKTGISLVTDQSNQIVIDQSGKIQLCPAPDGQVEIHGSLKVQTPTLQLEISDRGIHLQAGGAKIAIDSNGNLDLTPSPTGKVHIHGDVEVHGQLNTQLSEALKQSILAELSTTLSTMRSQELVR